MKKSLIALAVLAASGAAMAQSTVTLYGIADVWLGSLKREQGAVSTRTTQLVSGGVSSSRFGFRGSEDLGGGLKANFVLEQGFNLDDGLAGNTVGAGNVGNATAAFSRQAWVGLSGGFGEVRLGKNSSPLDNFTAATNGVFDSDLSPTTAPGGTVFISRAGTFRDKVDNAIMYRTPNLSGFSAEALYSLDEQANGSVATALGVTGFNVRYTAGGLSVGLGYQQDETALTTDRDLEVTRFAASYDFGVATARFIYATVDNAGFVAGNTDEYMLGFEVPLSSSLTLAAAYAVSEDKAPSTLRERDGFGVALSYSLSKRTSLYGGFKYVKTEQARTSDIKENTYAIGVRHSF